MKYGIYKANDVTVELSPFLIGRLTLSAMSLEFGFKQTMQEQVLLTTHDDLGLISTDDKLLLVYQGMNQVLELHAVTSVDEALDNFPQHMANFDCHDVELAEYAKTGYLRLLKERGEHKFTENLATMEDMVRDAFRRGIKVPQEALDKLDSLGGKYENNSTDM